MLGDGKTPLKVEGNPFLPGGLTLPRVRLGDLGGHVAIEKGVAKLQGVEAKSPDGELALEGEVTLRDPLPTSTVNAYLRFKLTRRLPQAGGRGADDAADGGRAGQAARRVLRRAAVGGGSAS